MEIEFTSWWFHLAISMLYPNILIKICEPSQSLYFIYSFFPSPSWCLYVLCILVSPCFPHYLFSVFIFVYFNRPWCRLPADRPLITFTLSSILMNLSQCFPSLFLNLLCYLFRYVLQIHDKQRVQQTQSYKHTRVPF